MMERMPSTIDATALLFDGRGFITKAVSVKPVVSNDASESATAATTQLAWSPR
jgi:hypothetical protein